MLDDPSLLVVDDEEAICESCRRIFTGKGFAVEQSTDPVKGLSLATENNYSAILLDLKMPQMSGIQFFEKIRGEKPDLPVVFITGYPTMLSNEPAIGDCEFVTKPFSPEQITEAVERSLARKSDQPAAAPAAAEELGKAVDLKKIVVVVRQVPDPVEGLEIGDEGTSLDMDEVSFIVNEYDNEAIEQALTLKNAVGGSVTLVALDFGDVDDTLYTAAARGVDDIVKIPFDEELPPTPNAAAKMYAEVVKSLEPDLVLTGVQADDELDGLMAPRLASSLDLPYVGVIRGVQTTDTVGNVRAFKELGGAVMAQLNVRLPAVLGILASDERPKYVSVSRIRAAMKSTQFEETEVELPANLTNSAVQRLYCPEVGERAEILEGSDDEVAARITEILVEKGIIK